ncbi:MAG TPA: L-lysine dehydrogenase [Alphaproteobacteria bacterium]|nr:L-lysine dehydrogenase [Alphaproteobacteria bacterium]
MIKKVLITGLGKVGSLVATLLSESKFDVTGLDRQTNNKFKFKTISGDVANADFLKKILKNYDAVVSALPYNLNKQLVKIAAELGVHYFDLTEDVPTADYINMLAKKSKSVLAPQCGLAPGFIAIVGADLSKNFDEIRSIELRVGALPQSPKGDLGYAFNWSAEGVVNEYLNDCKIIDEGKIKLVPAMQDLEKIVIDGKTLECFTTSGGLGTMCETYLGKVKKLNYKTMRYPGHMKLMKFYFHELMMKEDRKKAGEILVNAKPPVNDDVVYVHAAVEGYKTKAKNKKELYRDEFVKAYYPKTIAGQEWRAISWTTACSIAAVVEMVSKGDLPQKGLIKQEEISFAKFLKTKNGWYYN